ncbi:L-lactate permease [Kutzneria sp. CA-103260]|uniref:L-lactate permease n=1 Tax=Kutzneria sp. CA-103260 TaxID=2802641 RepID=UPI001BA53AE1|nr:L-lactate permease [Kutzneria sp. CA-103260]QUQ66893.1 L-lactate permease [Kutzneria sp. CA-103260]
MYTPVLAPVAGSLTLSALLAALPLVVLFVLLGVFRIRAWLAAAISLAVSLLVAVLGYPMPVGQAVLAATEGAAFGFFPILWIVINAIWIYNMTVHTGHFDVLRRSFARISDDQRIQGVIVAFSFGALLEALAGFGTPVAVTSVMLVALGFQPLKAATVALVANTAPVAFGALAAPITTLATVSGLPLSDLAAMVGRQTPVLAVFVPMVLVGIIDGWRGVRETLPATLTCGVVFAIAQYATSNFFSAPLTDIVASLLSALAVVAVVRRRSKAEATDSRVEVFRAYAPYAIIIIVFALAQVPAIKNALTSVTVTFNWPGLHLATLSGKASTLPAFKFDWLDAAGSLLVIAGLITIPVIKIGTGAALRAYGGTYRQLATAIVTVMAVLALAYVMNASGQTTTLGTWMANAGGLFALLSPVLGWLGVAVTGSDTSSNSLFGALQVTAAQHAGLSPTLMAAANSAGGVLGKMISPQNLAIVAGAVGLAGREGDLFRRVFLWSLILLAAMCLLVFLQSTPILSWMVV